MNTNPDVKKIVCYGDSNTWGRDPKPRGQHAASVRYTGVLQNALGNMLS